MNSASYLTEFTHEYRLSWGLPFGTVKDSEDQVTGLLILVTGQGEVSERMKEWVGLV